MIYHVHSLLCFVVTLKDTALNTLRPRQDGRHFPDEILRWIFLNENLWILINISLKFVPRVPINNIPALVQIMAWRRQATSHYLNQWWLVYWRIYASLGLNELTQMSSYWFSWLLEPLITSKQLSVQPLTICFAWWCHQMETFSASMAICVGNPPSQRPVTRSFDDSFDLRLNKWLSKQAQGWWFETPLCPLWRHCNGQNMN